MKYVFKNKNGLYYQTTRHYNDGYEDIYTNNLDDAYIYSDTSLEPMLDDTWTVYENEKREIRKLKLNKLNIWEKK